MHARPFGVGHPRDRVTGVRVRRIVALALLLVMLLAVMDCGGSTPDASSDNRGAPPTSPAGAGGDPRATGSTGAATTPSPSTSTSSSPWFDPDRTLPSGIPALAAPAEERGVPLDVYYAPFDISAADLDVQLAFFVSQGVNTVYVTASEKDLADDRRLRLSIERSHAFGLYVVLDPYLGGSFSGDEGNSATGILADDPSLRGLSRFGQPATVPAINATAYQDRLRSSITAFMAYDAEAFVLDEPQYPEADAHAEGDYFPYDPAAQEQFEQRYGRPMPEHEDADVVQFRRDSMKAFLASLFRTAKDIRGDLDTRLVVLPNRHDDNDRRGTEDWADLATITEIDGLSTDPYLGPGQDDDLWPYFTQNLAELKAAARPDQALGVWINMHSLGAGDYTFMSRCARYAREQGIRQLDFWVTDLLPNADPAQAWAELRRSFAAPTDSPLPLPPPMPFTVTPTPPPS